MPSKNPRINMTFEPELLAVLARLAKRESKTIAGFAKDLVFEALERREDKALAALAEKRDIKNAKRHKLDDVWDI